MAITDMILDDTWAWNSTILNHIVRNVCPFQLSQSFPDFEGGFSLLITFSRKRNQLPGTSEKLILLVGSYPAY